MSPSSLGALLERQKRARNENHREPSSKDPMNSWMHPNSPKTPPWMNPEPQHNDSHTSHLPTSVTTPAVTDLAHSLLKAFNLEKLTQEPTPATVAPPTTTTSAAQHNANKGVFLPFPVNRLDTKSSSASSNPVFTPPSSPTDTHRESPKVYFDKLSGLSSNNDKSLNTALDKEVASLIQAATPRSKSLLWLSECLGSLYILCWVISFYPQICLNAREKSVAGLSLDFVVLNLFGYICFMGYTSARYAAVGHFNLPRSVRLHDIVCCAHALIMCLIYSIQCCAYDKGGQRIGIPARWLILTLIVVLGTNAVLAAKGIIPWFVSHPVEWNLDPQIFKDAMHKVTGGHRILATVDVHWVDLQTWSFVQCLGFIKVFINFVRLLPQLVLNARRKSTQGLSTGMITLEFFAAVFAVAQNGVDSVNYGTLKPIMGTPNMSKVFVSVISALLAFIILFQIICVYRGCAPIDAVYEQLKDVTDPTFGKPFDAVRRMSLSRPNEGANGDDVHSASAEIEEHRSRRSSNAGHVL